MRHGIAGNKLNRKTSHRKATIRDIAKAVLIQQRICTTKAKAKEARKLADQLITMGKKGTLAEKRHAFAVLCDHKLVSKLFSKIAPRFKERKGGYTRIIPYGFRKGDNAELAFLELTEKEEVVVSKPKVKKAVKKESLEKSVKDTPKIKPEEKTKTSPKAKEKAKEEVADVAKEQKAEDKKAAEKPKPEKKTNKSEQKKTIVGGIKNIFKKKSSDK